MEASLFNRQAWINFVLTMFAAGFLLSAQSSPSHNASEGPRWCEFAREYLSMPGGKPFNCAATNLRCIRMNNYSCTKNFFSRPYDGQLINAEGRPVTDVDHHVIYEDPQWSIQKSIDVLRDYYVRRGKKSALAIAETWAPWCDTNGSKLIHQGWGRTCQDGPGAVPASFEHKCVRPANGVPLPGQCGPCNCPNELAAFYVKDAEVAVSADLHLFDGQGQPTNALSKVLKRVVWMEIGFQPSDSLIHNAVNVYKP